MVNTGNFIVDQAGSVTFQVTSCNQERLQIHVLSLGFSLACKIITVQKELDSRLCVSMSPVVGIKNVRCSPCLEGVGRFISPSCERNPEVVMITTNMTLARITYQVPF